jgi:hypothetical protein
MLHEAIRPTMLSAHSTSVLRLNCNSGTAVSVSLKFSKRTGFGHTTGGQAKIWVRSLSAVVTIQPIGMPTTMMARSVNAVRVASTFRRVCHFCEPRKPGRVGVMAAIYCLTSDS